METKIVSPVAIVDLPKNPPSVKKNEKSETQKPEEKELKPQDQKDIDKGVSAPVKSKPINFIEDKQLTKQKIEGVVSKVAVSVVSKVSVQTVTKSVAKVETKVAEKAIAKVGGKAVAESVGKKLLQSLWVNGSQTVLMSAGEEVTLKVIENTAKTAAKKGGEQAGKKISGAVPVVGAIIEAGFTLYDAKYAYDLSKDKKATFASKALAWATVGLDAVSMVCTATGVGTPIAWAATGLSVVTSVASDMLKYKK